MVITLSFSLLNLIRNRCKCMFPVLTLHSSSRTIFEGLSNYFQFVFYKHSNFCTCPCSKLCRSPCLFEFPLKKEPEIRTYKCRGFLNEETWFHGARGGTEGGKADSGRVHYQGQGHHWECVPCDLLRSIQEGRSELSTEVRVLRN